MNVKVTIFTAVRRMNNPEMTDKQVIAVIQRTLGRPYGIVGAVGWTYLSQQLNQLFGPIFEREDFRDVCDFGWEYSKRTRHLRVLFESCLNTIKTPVNVEDFL